MTSSHDTPFASTARRARSKLFIGALPSPLRPTVCVAGVPLEPCPWCYRDAGLEWPESNPSSLICLRHSALLRSQRRRSGDNDGDAPAASQEG